MPRVSRGVFRWLFHRVATLEDFADRLNHVWTVGLLLILACVISWRHAYTNPITCWTPVQFTEALNEYARTTCWNSPVLAYGIPSYELPADLQMPRVYQTPQGPDGVSVEYTALYQWIPLILCFQALLFKLPNIVLYVCHGYSGISFDKIAGLTNGYENLNLQERQILARQIARYVYRWCRQCGDCLPWRLLTLLWLLVKVLYLVNAVVQLNAFDKYMNTYYPLRANSTWYGDVITGNILTNNITLWHESGAFPRRMLCNFDVHVLNRKHMYTVSCMLPGNAFTEQALMYLWVWLVFVTIVTCLSLVIWVLTTAVPVLRKRYMCFTLVRTQLTSALHHHDVPVMIGRKPFFKRL